MVARSSFQRRLGRQSRTSCPGSHTCVACRLKTLCMSMCIIHKDGAFFALKIQTSVLACCCWCAYPAALQVVSLGSHLLDPSPASPPLLLMEVMPQSECGGVGEADRLLFVLACLFVF